MGLGLQYARVVGSASSALQVLAPIDGSVSRRPRLEILEATLRSAAPSIVDSGLICANEFPHASAGQYSFMGIFTFAAQLSWAPGWARRAVLHVLLISSLPGASRDDPNVTRIVCFVAVKYPSSMAFLLDAHAVCGSTFSAQAGECPARRHPVALRQWQSLIVVVPQLYHLPSANGAVRRAPLHLQGPAVFPALESFTIGDCQTSIGLLLAYGCLQRGRLALFLDQDDRHEEAADLKQQNKDIKIALDRLRDLRDLYNSVNPCVTKFKAIDRHNSHCGHPNCGHRR
ncbi:hypothetical protein B0H13DRAFT_1856465 [Mycena leptocephala]|nr:hypothetical protein B0H13DRAFT_1856465 [Mycena leptocephala]